MAETDIRGGGRRSATPVLSSEAAKRVRERTQRAWERDVNFMVAERSAYRLAWPAVLILLTTLNVILAGDYMVRIAEPGGGAGAFGLSRNELINWFIAFALIVTTSILVILTGDDETQGAGAWWSRLVSRLVIAGLIAFSVWTAAAETATKLQSKVDRGAMATAQVEVAGDVVMIARDALRGSQADLDAARADLADAKRQATDARAAWAAYQADAKARFTGSDLAWTLNATHSQGPARPHVEAINSADAIVEASRNRLAHVQRAVTASRADLTGAQRAKASAIDAPGSEGTVIESFGAMVPAALGGPWSAPIVIAAWGWIAAILLEVTRYAGASATGRILRESLNRHSATRGDAADTIKREAAQKARTAQPPAPVAAIPNAGGGGLTFDPAALAGFMGGGQAAKAQPIVATDPAAEAAKQAKYAEKIADAIADTETGILDDASFPAIKRAYAVSQDGAAVIREALVDRGLFIAGPGNTLVRAA